jgi:chromate reductase
MKALQLLAIPGSLRKASFNRRALVALTHLLPDGVEARIITLEGIPFYDADLPDVPEAVQAFKDQVQKSDGVVIATPEFNYGIPGVLKNALDWASRPAYQSVFSGKPVAVLGAAPSPVGTARAQGQLKQVLLGMVADVFPYPEVAIGSAAERLGEDGAILDERTKKQLGDFVHAYVARLRRA